MNKYNTLAAVLEENVIRITMYLYPEIYSDFGSRSNINCAGYLGKDKKYHTDVNPATIINGPFSEYGQELEPPIKDEFNAFKDDCEWLVKQLGFTVIKRYTSTDSKKSEYIIVFGLDDKPCGKIVYDLRISDHPFDADFPEDLQDEVLEYLKMNKVLDGTATKAGIEFQVEKITVGKVRNDTWDKAFYRLSLLLKRMRRHIQIMQK